MSLYLKSFLIINLIFVLGFLIGMMFIFNKDKHAKLIAYYSLFLAVMMTIYLGFIIFLSIFAGIHKNFIVLPLVIPFIATFVIGRFVTYSSLKFYSNVQVLSLLFSLFYALFLVVKVFN